MADLLREREFYNSQYRHSVRGIALSRDARVHDCSPATRAGDYRCANFN